MNLDYYELFFLSFYVEVPVKISWNYLQMQVEFAGQTCLEEALQKKFTKIVVGEM